MPTLSAERLAGYAKWAGFATCGDPELEKLLRGVAEWREAVAAGCAPIWLTLCGNSGTGKTYLAKRLWRSLTTRRDFNPPAVRFAPYFTHWPDFVDELRGGESFGYFNDMKGWPYLALDDIGAERDPSGFATEKLSTLLACRSGKWTIITSNLSLPEIAKADKRIASRMVRDGSIVVDCRAKDFASRQLRK